MWLIQGEPTQVQDTAVYLRRLLRLNSAAVVRLRSVDDQRLALWSWLPLDVLAMRGMVANLSGEADPGARFEVDTPVPDVTVRADALLAQISTAVNTATAKVALPPTQDLAWRGPLPPSKSVLLDTIPPDVVAQLVAAAEQTFREASAIAAIPQRAGEALLDHVVLSVTGSADHAQLAAQIRVRQLIAAARLGFLGTGEVRVGAILGGGGEEAQSPPAWTILSCQFGVIYQRSTSLLG